MVLYIQEKICSVEALQIRHPRDAKEVSITRTGHLRECKNTEFVWKLRKTGLRFGKEAVSRAVRLNECPLWELLLYSLISLPYYGSPTWLQSQPDRSELTNRSHPLRNVSMIVRKCTLMSQWVNEVPIKKLC